jgi:hypothetical protein
VFGYEVSHFIIIVVSLGLMNDQVEKLNKRIIEVKGKDVVKAGDFSIVYGI